MISGFDPASEQFLSAMSDLQARIDNAQNQVATGKRVTKASDAPQDVGDIFQQRADLARVNQIDQNLNIVKTQVDTADSALQSAVKLLENAAQLGAQGANTTAPDTLRAALSSQVRALESQLVALTRTQVNGVFIFSGDASGSPPYQVNSASPTGVDRLVTAQATQQIQDPAGVTFQIAMTAQDLFDKRDVNDNIAPENAFAALNNLQLALQSGDSTAISQAIDSIHTVSAYLNQQLGFYGSAQNRISAAIDLAKKFEVQSQNQLSNLEDADLPAAATELTQATTLLQAAMAARSKRPTTTLFDYLPLG